MDEIKIMLDEVIKIQLLDLKRYPPESEEKTKVIDDLTKLYKLRIDETKNELDADERFNKNNLELVQLEEKKWERYFKTGIEVAGITLPLVFYGIWMGRGLKFEETGTYTSQTFKGLINMFKLKK